MPAPLPPPSSTSVQDIATRMAAALGLPPPGSPNVGRRVGGGQDSARDGRVGVGQAARYTPGGPGWEQLSPSDRDLYTKIYLGRTLTEAEERRRRELEGDIEGPLGPSGRAAIGEAAGATAGAIGGALSESARRASPETREQIRQRAGEYMDQGMGASEALRMAEAQILGGTPSTTGPTLGPPAPSTPTQPTLPATGGPPGGETPDYWNAPVPREQQPGYAPTNPTQPSNSDEDIARRWREGGWNAISAPEAARLRALPNRVVRPAENAAGYLETNTGEYMRDLTPGTDVTWIHAQDPTTGQIWWFNPKDPTAEPIKGKLIPPEKKVTTQIAEGYAWTTIDGVLQKDPTFVGRDITTPGGSSGRTLPDGSIRWYYRSPNDLAQYTNIREVGGRVLATTQDGQTVQPPELQPAQKPILSNGSAYYLKDPNDPTSLVRIDLPVADWENWERIQSPISSSGYAIYNRKTNEIKQIGDEKPAPREKPITFPGSDRAYDPDAWNRDHKLVEIEVPGRPREMPITGPGGKFYNRQIYNDTGQWVEERIPGARSKTYEVPEGVFEYDADTGRTNWIYRKAPDEKPTPLGQGWFMIPGGMTAGTVRKSESPSGDPWAYVEFTPGGGERVVDTGAAWELAKYLERPNFIMNPNNFQDFYRGVQMGQQYQSGYGSSPWDEEEQQQPWQGYGGNAYGYMDNAYGWGQDVGSGADYTATSNPNIIDVAGKGQMDWDAAKEFGINRPTAAAAPAASPSAPASSLGTPTKTTSSGLGLGLGTPTTRRALPAPRQQLALPAPRAATTAAPPRAMPAGLSQNRISDARLAELVARGRNVAGVRGAAAPMTAEQQAQQRQSPYNPDGSLNYQALGMEVYGDPTAKQKYIDQYVNENRGRFASQVSRGLMTQEQMDQAIAYETAAAEKQAAKQPGLMAAGLPILQGKRSREDIAAGQWNPQNPQQWVEDQDIWTPDGRRLRRYTGADGQSYLAPVVASGGYVMNKAGQVVADPRTYDPSGRLVEGASDYFGGAPQQKTYRSARTGETYSVPHYAGPSRYEDELIGGFGYREPYKVWNGGAWVDEGQINRSPTWAGGQMSSGQIYGSTPNMPGYQAPAPTPAWDASNPEYQNVAAKYNANAIAYENMQAQMAQQKAAEQQARMNQYWSSPEGQSSLAQMSPDEQQARRLQAGLGQDSARDGRVGSGMDTPLGGLNDWSPQPTTWSGVGDFSGDFVSHAGARKPWTLTGAGQDLFRRDDPELSYPFQLGVGGDEPWFGVGAEVPPVPPEAVVGTGHKFGDEVSMEGIHKGTDLQAVQGTPALAPVTGTVVDVKYEEEGLGLQVLVQSAEDGTVHKLSHLLDAYVEPGDKVEAGEEIAVVGSSGAGSTGPHLDYRIMSPDESQYFNPEPSLGPLAQMPRADKGGPMPGMPMGGMPMGGGQDMPWEVGAGADDDGWEYYGNGQWYNVNSGEEYYDDQWDGGGTVNAASWQDEGDGGTPDQYGRYPGDMGYGTLNSPDYYAGYGNEWDPTYLDPLDWTDMSGFPTYEQPSTGGGTTGGGTTGGGTTGGGAPGGVTYNGKNTPGGSTAGSQPWNAGGNNDKPTGFQGYPSARDTGASSRGLTGGAGTSGISSDEASQYKEQLDRQYQLAKDRLDMEKSQFGETMDLKRREMELDNDYRTAQVQLGYAELAHKEGYDTAQIYLAIERNQLDKTNMENQYKYQQDRLDLDRLIHGDSMELQQMQMAIDTDFNERRLAMDEQRWGLEQERLSWEMEAGKARLAMDWQTHQDETAYRQQELQLRAQLAQMQMASEQARLGLDTQRLAVEQQRAAMEEALGYARIGQDDRRLASEEKWNDAKIALETSQLESENAWRQIQADVAIRQLDNDIIRTQIDQDRLGLDTRRTDAEIANDALRLELERQRLQQEKEQAELNRQTQIQVQGTFEQRRQAELMDSALRNPWMQQLLGMAPGALEPGGPGWSQLFSRDAATAGGATTGALGQAMGGTPTAESAQTAGTPTAQAATGGTSNPKNLPSFAEYADQSIFQRAANRIKGEFAGTPWEQQAQDLREYWMNSGGPTTAPDVTQLAMAAGGPRAQINASQIANTLGQSTEEYFGEQAKNWQQAAASQVQQQA